MPILCLVDLSIVGRGAEGRNEVRGGRTNSKGVELRIDMQLLCLFHGSDCFILVTRAKEHIGYRSTWPGGFESSQDTCQIRRVGRVLLIVDDVEIVARGIGRS